MEKISSAQEDLLLGYLDGSLEAEQVAQLERQLSGSSSLRERLEELKTIHESLITISSSLQSPPATFTAKVMNNLHSKQYVPSGSLSPRNGLLLLIGIMIAAGFLIVMLSAGMFDQFVSIDGTLPVKNYFKQSLPSFSINSKLVIKIIIGLNMILAFVVLDRTVLKPFFQKRAGVQL